MREGGTAGRKRGWAGVTSGPGRCGLGVLIRAGGGVGAWREELGVLGWGGSVILTSPPFSSQMAQRLALRRLLALGRRPLPLGPRPLASQGLPGRAFGSSAIRGSAFNVQDGGDFQERVVNSPKPVVVDFHAQ